MYADLLMTWVRKWQMFKCGLRSACYEYLLVFPNAVAEIVSKIG